MRYQTQSLMAVVAALALGSSTAWAGPITLGDAADYIVLQYNAAGTGQTQFSISGGSTLISGPLGLAANTKGNFAYTSGNVTGPLDMSLTNTSVNFTAGMTVNKNATTTAALSQAVTDAKNASSTAAGLSANQTFNNVFSGGETISATVNGQNVIDLTKGINMTGTSGITIHGSATDTFVINVSSQFVSNNGTSLTLSGGITANDILWNYLGTSSASFTGGGHAQTWQGTILAPNAQISAHDRTFDGALIAGKSISITSNPVVNFNPFTPPPQPVPEPSTLVLSALAGLVLLSKRGLAVLSR